MDEQQLKIWENQLAALLQNPITRESEILGLMIAIGKLRMRLRLN